MALPTEITWFPTPKELLAWLAKHHQSAADIHLGLIKKGSSKKGIQYGDALDAVLAYGWIDGVRRSIDAETWTIRFTPRKKGSIWSAVNIRRVGELTAEGRMKPSGLAAFEARTAARSQIYAYEQRDKATLEEAENKLFRANKPAHAFFEKCPPGYRQQATYWVCSAKQATTRARRLATLIAHSAAGERLPQYVSTKYKPVYPK